MPATNTDVSKLFQAVAWISYICVKRKSIRMVSNTNTVNWVVTHLQASHSFGLYRRLLTQSLNNVRCKSQLRSIVDHFGLRNPSFPLLDISDLDSILNVLDIDDRCLSLESSQLRLSSEIFNHVVCKQTCSIWTCISSLELRNIEISESHSWNLLRGCSQSLSAIELYEFNHIFHWVIFVKNAIFNLLLKTKPKSL